MTESAGILRDLALVSCTAAVTTVVCQRLKQPVVLGYLLAGAIVGPHIPIPLVADEENIRTLSELGVVLLMFSLGLEFSVRRLFSLGASAVFVTLVQVGLTLWLGFVAGRALGWDADVSVFAGAAIAISSTMIVVKVFAERPVARGVRDLALAVLIGQDLCAIVLMAVLTAVSAGAGLEPATFAAHSLELALFLATMIAGGLILVPRFLRWVMAARNRETTLVASVGLCFAFALLAQRAGYSTALGAFLAGSLAAESGHGGILEPLVRPVRDVFAAVFFVSVGMLIDPALALEHWQPVLVFTLLVTVGKLASLAFGAILAGHGVPTAVATGMSLTQIGEFSFLIAAVAAPLGERVAFLYPTCAAVCVVTAFTTPWFVRGAEPVARWVDRRMPRSVQTFHTLYASWLERLRSRPAGERSAAVRTAAWIAADAVALIALVIGVSLALPQLVDWSRPYLGEEGQRARWLVLLAAALASAPFVVGISRSSRRLALQLAAAALPSGSGGSDFAAAPRRSLVVALRLAILLSVGVPLLAIAQPFLPSTSGALALFVAAVAVGAVFWRSAADLEGHVRAGAQVVVEILARQTRAAQPHDLEPASELLPGIGELTPLKIEPECAAVGRSLAELDLHGHCGAAVVAIQRGEQGIVSPSGEERLRAGDVLALTGSEAAIELATERLIARPE